MPDDTTPYRETLIWDDSGRFLLLEIAGHRFYGYNTIEGKRLTDEELLAVKVTPLTLWQYGYGGDWPGIGKAKRE